VTGETAPMAAGIGLRAAHIAQILRERPPIPWLEVHSENLFAAGGAIHAAMERIRAHYPLSLHGVGLSLGSADALDGRHLNRLRELVDRYQPALVSEHLCWGAVDGRHSNDLLPLPFTEEAAALLVTRIGQVQDTLRRELVVENISAYLRFDEADYDEWEFIATVVKRSGCGLLCDINNIYVNSINHGFDPQRYIQALPRRALREFHLAGFSRRGDTSPPLLIDTHSRPVDEAVWALYAKALALIGPAPTLIEWDRDIPALDTLLAEAARANELLDAHRTRAA